MKDVGGAGFAGSSPPFLGREQAAVDVDVGPERRRPLAKEPRRHFPLCAAVCKGSKGASAAPRGYGVPATHHRTADPFTCIHTFEK